LKKTKISLNETHTSVSFTDAKKKAWNYTHKIASHTEA